MHITKRRDQARANTRFGFLKWLDYFNKIIPACYADRAGHDPIYRLVGTGRIVCGTRDDAIAPIEKFYESSAEFGCFLQAAHNWADFEATEKSYELYARYVVPHFRQPDVNRAASHAWTLEHTKDFNARREKPA